MVDKKIVVGMISILEEQQLQVRVDTVFSEDGTELSRTYWRTTLLPGDDVSTQRPEVQRVAAFVWTPEVIAAWKARPSVLPPFVPRVQ
jgi:hypothetical protein